MKPTHIRKIAALAAVAATALCSHASDFDKQLCDTTLRVDYTLAANMGEPAIYHKSSTRYAGWAGRRHDMKKPHLRGMMQVTMQNAETGDTLYATSLNPLFSEWLALPESQDKSCSMTVPVQLPMPRGKVLVTATLENYSQQPIATVKHIVDPADILIRRVESNPHKRYYLGEPGAYESCVDLVVIPEGYTAAEMDTFRKDCENFADALFSYKPFSERRENFNVLCVELPSNQSGVSVPREHDWKDTALGSNYDTFYSARYLTISDLSRVADLLDGLMYDTIVILANTETYGGGGFYNSNLLTASHNPKWREVSVHEFGHSFAGLGDEYAYEGEYDTTYPLDVEPWEKNITTLVDFDSKWKGMVDPKLGMKPVTKKMEGTDEYRKVGLFEGGGYKLKGVYRPVQNCRMRSNDVPEFCPVCQKAITEAIDSYVSK